MTTFRHNGPILLVRLDKSHLFSVSQHDLGPIHITSPLLVTAAQNFVCVSCTGPN